MTLHVYLFEVHNIVSAPVFLSCVLHIKFEYNSDCSLYYFTIKQTCKISAIYKLYATTNCICIPIHQQNRSRVVYTLALLYNIILETCFFLVLVLYLFLFCKWITAWMKKLSTSEIHSLFRFIFRFLGLWI